MYHPIKNGTTELLYNDKYECWIPPLGYGISSITGKPEPTDIIKRSENPKEQYWERTLLPKDWEKKRKLESQRQTLDTDYYDKSLEEFREQEWKRRICGAWVYILGKAYYLTGDHYMYLNWWYLDAGYPDYRDPDRKRFYVLQFCIEDDRCAGLVEASNRRSGKSYRGGLFLYEYTSRTMDANSGLQSKTDKDASNLFKGKIVTPFRRLPDFFRPEIDKYAGAAPDKELKFTTTKRRGKHSIEDIGDLGLNSYINFMSSEQYAYDGWKIHRYLGDEVGKTANVNIYDRHQVVKYCLRVGKKWIGKALYTTTVENIENGEGVENFELLWKESNSDERDKNGHTKSGLYRYFMPAYEMHEFDRYGFPLIEQNKEYFLNTRAGLQHNPRALSSEIRKNPFTEREMFWIDGKACLYDAIKLNFQLDAISWRENLTEKGNFVWQNGEAFTKVVWEKTARGRFEITRLLGENEANKVIQKNGGFWPNNYMNITMGCDPFKYDKVADNRRSDCAAFAFQKYSVLAKDDPYNESFIAMYSFRAATTSQQYEDILKMAWYYGCQILFERNIDNWKDFFRTKKCEGFLMMLPGEQDYGLYSDGRKLVHQQLADFTEAYINEHCEKVFFKELINDWLLFDIGATGRYDLSMAAGYTLIACREKLYKKHIDNSRDISEYFTLHKAS